MKKMNKMRKQEAIEQARKEILECVENGKDVHNYGIEDNCVIFYSADNDNNQIVHKHPFEPEMIPGVTEAYCWDRERRPKYPYRFLFAHYKDGVPMFNDTDGKPWTWECYEIIPPDHKDKEIERLQGLLTAYTSRMPGCLVVSSGGAAYCGAGCEYDMDHERKEVNNKQIIEIEVKND